jgi:hypothetical protein
MLEAIVVSAAILMGATAWGQNTTPESCAKLGLAYVYHGDTGTSSCVPHAGTQSVPPETSDVLPNGGKESTVGCLAATAHTNGPCKLTYPNGNIMETRADGTTWVTIKKLDIKFQVFSDLPVTGLFQTNIITKLPESDIIEAPQFEKTNILGDCQSKTYQIMGTLITDPNGFFDYGSGPEDVKRRVIPDTPVDIVFRAFCGAPAPTKPSAEVQKLMDQEEELNDECRDGVGSAWGASDMKLTMKVCAIRDTILAQIKSQGWCWGHDDQRLHSRFTWEPCPAKP